MDSLIPDGIYKIRNVEFNEQIAALQNHTIRDSPIVGAPDDLATTKLWTINNIGYGGNQIIITSVARPDIFANARQLQQGGSLIGSRDGCGTAWFVLKVDGGYYLQSPVAHYVWELPEADAPIVLVPPTSEDNIKWTFERVILNNH